MPTKFIELTRIEDEKKILINVAHISKFYSIENNTQTMIWIDGGYICVKEEYMKIRHLLIHGLGNKYNAIIM